VLEYPVVMAVPTAVGPAELVLLRPKVEVTEATTCETVIVLVRVCVEVRVVVAEEVESAMASRGRRRVVANLEKRIVKESGIF
jgi:hypothetical protein